MLFAKFLVLRKVIFIAYLGAESLTKTIESVAASKYPAHRKLLFIICDGMIMGFGNGLLLINN
jgi:uncharacterized membrane-anchored protein YitT (DUF2179 family)